MRLTSGILLIVATAALTCVPTYTQGHIEDIRKDYILVWQDEFDADSLDRSVWNVEINGSGCGNNELQHYIDSPENVSVADGKLMLTARRQQYGDSHQFTSGRINTHRKFTFTYGIVEASILLPKTSDGLWPAFWMMGDDISENSWPYCGETDILEMGHADGIAASTQERLFNGALHYGTDTGAHRQTVGSRTNPYSLQDGRYHKFYVVWTPECIEMYVDNDNEPYLRMDISKRDTPDQPGFYFHKPNFILLNLAVGGNFPDIHDPAKISALGENDEATMTVDYVRVYQRNTDTASNQ